MAEPTDRFWPRYVSTSEERRAGRPRFVKVSDPSAFRYNRDRVSNVDWVGLAEQLDLGSVEAAKDWFAKQPRDVRKEVRKTLGLHKTEMHGERPFPIVSREDLLEPDRRTDRGGDPTLLELLRGEIADPVLDMLNINEEERHRPDPFHGGRPRSPGFRALDKANRDLGHMLGTESGTATGGLASLMADYEENVAKPFRRDIPGEYVPMYAQGLGVWSPEEAAAYRDRVTNRPNLAEAIAYDPLTLFDIGAMTKLAQGRRLSQGAGSLEDIAKFRNLHTPERNTLVNRMTGEFDPGRRRAMGGIAAGAAGLAGLKGAMMGGPEAAKVASTVAHVSGADPTGPRMILEGILKHGSDKGRAELLDSIGDAALQSGKGGDPIEWFHRPGSRDKRTIGESSITRYESLGDLLKAEKRKVTSGDLKHLDHTDRDVQIAIMDTWGKRNPRLALAFNDGTFDLGRYAEEQENLSKFWAKLYRYSADGRGAAKGLSFTEYANLPRTRKRIAKVEEANKYYLQHTPEGSMDEMMKSGLAKGAPDVYGDNPLSFHAHGAGMNEDAREIMYDFHPDEVEREGHWFMADEAMEDLKIDMMYAMGDPEIWGDKSKFLGSLAHEGKRQYIPAVEQGLRQALGVETSAGQHAAQTLDDFLLYNIHEMERSRAAGTPWPITRTEKYGLHELYGDEAIRYLQKQRMAVKKNGIFAADEGVLHEWADNDMTGYIDAKWSRRHPDGSRSRLKTIGTVPRRERNMHELTFRLPFDKTPSVGPSQAPKRRVSLQESLKRAGASEAEMESAGAFDLVEPPIVKMWKRRKK